MNIHINDIELFSSLKNSSLIKVEVGSSMYKLNDSNSDIDYLYIYATSNNELLSFLNNTHQIQYKENNIDHNFVSLHNFIKNSINGESTINFEVINSNLLIGTCLEFLYLNRTHFNNYSMIRSYCGLARRDFMHYGKAKTHRDQIKKILHIYRGYYFAKSILENDFELINNNLLNISIEIRAIEDTNFKLKKKYLNDAMKLVSDLRNELNIKFNNKTLNLNKYMSIDGMKCIDNELLKLTSLDLWKEKSSYLNDFDMSLYYNAYENWVSYD